MFVVFVEMLTENNIWSFFFFLEYIHMHPRDIIETSPPENKSLL